MVATAGTVRVGDEVRVEPISDLKHEEENGDR
jgi:hypothetical protein